MLVIHAFGLGCGILAAVGIWRAAFDQHLLSKREALIGAPAGILCGGLTIYMGAGKNPGVLPLVLVLWALVVYMAAKAIRQTYLREKARRGWPWPQRLFP